ncbi:TPR-like protein [Apiospora marii]|uniref:TPR-like protein n=1 Tax=Apiospora marii TaxID=335849 RepID=A0ABR1STI2_9PEZI
MPSINKNHMLIGNFAAEPTFEFSEGGTNVGRHHDVAGDKVKPWKDIVNYSGQGNAERSTVLLLPGTQQYLDQGGRAPSIEPTCVYLSEYQWADTFRRFTIRALNPDRSILTTQYQERGYQGPDEKHPDISAERWEEALKRCEKSIDPSDFKIVSQFDSPEKLIIGISDVQASQNQEVSSLKSLLWQVHETQLTCKDALAAFAVMMSPRNVATGLIWGLIYLVIKLSSPAEETAKNLKTMLGEIRRQLAILQKRSSTVGLDDRTELRRTFVDIFENLIYFWRDCIVYLRKFPPETEEWTHVETSFKETMLKLDRANKYLETLFGPTLKPLSTADASLSSQTVKDDPSLFPVNMVPESHTKVFVGREDTLDDMESVLGIEVGCKTSLRVYVLWGIGGVGKTQLAREFSYSHRAKFEAILWVGAETQQSLKIGFTNIGIELGLPEVKVDGDTTYNLTLVQRWLRATNRPWLLILDNVEKYTDVSNFLPKCGAVIVTTRYQSQAELFPNSQIIPKVPPVSKLSPSSAESLFLRLLHSEDAGGISNRDWTIGMFPKEEQSAMQFLLSEVDGLALGIQQLAAIIKQREQIHDTANFARYYRQRLPDLIQDDDGIKGHSLATLWKVAFETIKSQRKKNQRNGNSWIMLGILCCCQPDSIARSLFHLEDDFGAIEELEFCKDEFEVDDAITKLRKVGLIEIEMTNGIISLHRLVQVAFLLQLEHQTLQTVFSAASLLIDNVFPKQIKGRPLHQDWSECQKHVKHGQSLAGIFEKLKVAKLGVKPTENFVSLMRNCAWYLFELGAWGETLDLINIVTNVCKDNDELSHAHLLNSAGMCYFYLNDLVQCRKALTESQRIREANLDPSDEELANTFLNLGNLESAEGKYDEAIADFDKSVGIRKGIAGAEVMLGVCHLTKARALINKKDYDAASGELDASMEVFIQSLGPEGFSVLFVHYTRGNLKLALGDAATAAGKLPEAFELYEEARGSYKLALEMLLERAPTQLKVAAMYFKLGTVEFRFKDYQAALTALNEGLIVARLRNQDGLGEVARNLRRQAQVLDEAAPLDPGSHLFQLADDPDPDCLRGAAESSRRQAEKGRYRVCTSPEEEEDAFNNLVVGFDR